MKLLIALVFVTLAAQAAPQPAPAPAAGQKAAAPATQPPPAKSAEPYTYSSEGRRDPFLSLVGVGSDGRAVKKGGEGLAGLSVADVSVRGVMQSRGALIAMIEGSDKKTYIVHQGDKFVDGTIKSITPTGIVVVQEVNDPLSLVKQREIIKLLHSLEGGKE